MPNREHEHQQDSTMHLINDSIIAGPNPPSVRNGGHLFASIGKRIVPQGFNLGGQSLLRFAREIFQLPERKRLKLNRIGHKRHQS